MKALIWPAITCGAEGCTLILLNKDDEKIVVSADNVVLPTNAADTFYGE